MKELSHIRELGYASIDQEVEIGLRSIAVPLTNFHGKVVAALKCSRPSWGKGSAPVPQGLDRGVKPLNINALGVITDTFG